MYLNRLNDFQGGFRKNRSTLDQVFYLHEVLASNQCHAPFLALQAAYDMVNSDMLWHNLFYKYEFDISLVKRLQTLFNGNRSSSI